MRKLGDGIRRRRFVSGAAAAVVAACAISIDVWAQPAPGAVDVSKHARRLVTHLKSSPFAVPVFEPDPGDIAVQFSIPVGPAGWKQSGSLGVPTDVLALEQDQERASTRRSPPYAWVVVTPGPKGASSYWVPVDDPRTVLHEFERPRKGLVGVRRKVPQGVLSVRLPFVPGARITLVAADGKVPPGWTEPAFTFPTTKPTTVFQPTPASPP